MPLLANWRSIKWRPAALSSPRSRSELFQGSSTSPSPVAMNETDPPRLHRPGPTRGPSDLNRAGGQIRLTRRRVLDDPEAIGGAGAQALRATVVPFDEDLKVVRVENGSARADPQPRQEEIDPLSTARERVDPFLRAGRVCPHNHSHIDGRSHDRVLAARRERPPSQKTGVMERGHVPRVSSPAEGGRGAWPSKGGSPAAASSQSTARGPAPSSKRRTAYPGERCLSETPPAERHRRH